jgi:hypothetical protein
MDDTLNRRRKLLQHQRAEIEKVHAKVYRETCGPLILDAAEDVVTTSKHMTGLMNAVLAVSTFYDH